MLVIPPSLMWMGVAQFIVVLDLSVYTLIATWRQPWWLSSTNAYLPMSCDAYSFLWGKPRVEPVFDQTRDQTNTQWSRETSSWGTLYHWATCVCYIGITGSRPCMYSIPVSTCRNGAYLCLPEGTSCIYLLGLPVSTCKEKSASFFRDYL